MSVEFRLEDIEDADLKIEAVNIYRGSSSGQASEGSDYGHTQGIHSITAPWERKLVNKNIGQAADLLESDHDAKKAGIRSVDPTTNSVRSALERLINYKVDQLSGTDEDRSQNRSKGQRTKTSVDWLDKLSKEKETHGLLITPSKQIRLNASINFIGANYNIASTPDREEAISQFHRNWSGIPIVESPSLMDELTASTVKTYYPVNDNKKLAYARQKRLDKPIIRKINFDSDDDEG